MMVFNTSNYPNPENINNYSYLGCLITYYLFFMLLDFISMFYISILIFLSDVYIISSFIFVLLLFVFKYKAINKIQTVIITPI